MFFIQALLGLSAAFLIGTMAMIYCAFQIIRSISIAKANGIVENPNKSLFYIGLAGSGLYFIVEFIRFILSLVNLFGFYIDFSYAPGIEAIAMLIIGLFFILALIKSHSKFKFYYIIGFVGVLLSVALYAYQPLLQTGLFDNFSWELSLHRYTETISLLLLTTFFIVELISKISKEKNLPFLGLVAMVILLPANLFFYFDIMGLGYYFKTIFIVIDSLYLVSALFLIVYFLKKLIIKDNI